LALLLEETAETAGVAEAFSIAGVSLVYVESYIDMDAKNLRKTVTAMVVRPASGLTTIWRVFHVNC
jgi:hypothetical protein